MSRQYFALLIMCVMLTQAVSNVSSSEDLFNVRVLGYATAKDIDSNGVPLGITNSFSAQDAFAYAWVALSRGVHPVQVTWRWRAPSGVVVSVDQQMTPVPSDTIFPSGFPYGYPYYVMYSRLPIARNSQVQVGLWVVEITIGDRRMSMQFQILDPKSEKSFPPLELRFMWGFSSNRLYGRDVVIGLPWVNLLEVKSSGDGKVGISYTHGLPDGRLSLFDQTGNILWEKRFYWILDSAISTDGNFIAVSEVPSGGGGVVYLYDRQGNFIFKTQTEDGCYVAVTSQGLVFCAEQYKEGLLELDNTGRVLWTHPKQLDSITNAVAVSASPTYFVVATKSIYLISIDGETLWKRSLGELSPRLIGGGVIGVDVSGDGQLITAGFEDGWMYLLDQAGKIRWSLPVALNRESGYPVSDYLPVSISEDGKTIIAYGDGGFEIIDTQGNVRWQAYWKGLYSALAFRSGHVYAGSVDSVQSFDLSGVVAEAIDFVTAELSQASPLQGKLSLNFTAQEQTLSDSKLAYSQGNWLNAYDLVKFAHELTLSEFSKRIQATTTEVEKTLAELEFDKEQVQNMILQTESQETNIRAYAFWATWGTANDIDEAYSNLKLAESKIALARSSLNDSTADFQAHNYNATVAALLAAVSYQNDARSLLDSTVATLGNAQSSLRLAVPLSLGVYVTVVVAVAGLFYWRYRKERKRSATA